MGGQEDLFAEMLGMGREPDRRVSAHLPPIAPEPQIDELEVQRLVVEEIAADKAALEADKAELEADKTKLEADKAALEADKTELEAKVLQIETEKQELSRQLEEAKREKSELEERLAEARGGLDELEEKLARMGRSLAAARRAVASQTSLRSVAGG